MSVRIVLTVEVECQLPISPPTSPDDARLLIACAMGNGLGKLWPQLAISKVEIADAACKWIAPSPEWLAQGADL